jgi:hypothetical protein
MSSPPIVHDLSLGDAVGLTFTSETGVISLIAVLGVLILIIVNVYRRIREDPVGWRLIQEPMELFLLSLFIAEIFQSFGAVMNWKWVHDGQVVQGAYCTAQGIIQQFGETSVAMTTLVCVYFGQMNGILTCNAFLISRSSRFTRLSSSGGVGACTRSSLQELA